MIVPLQCLIRILSHCAMKQFTDFIFIKEFILFWCRGCGIFSLENFGHKSASCFSHYSHIYRYMYMYNVYLRTCLEETFCQFFSVILKLSLTIGPYLDYNSGYHFHTGNKWISPSLSHLCWSSSCFVRSSLHGPTDRIQQYQGRSRFVISWS